MWLYRWLISAIYAKAAKSDLRYRKSLDDVMRLAYKRYSGEHGFTPDHFRQTVDEIAGADFRGWFKRAISSTDELDYSEALDWYGLQFAAAKEPAGKWRLEFRPDATETQKAHWQKLMGSPITRSEP